MIANPIPACLATELAEARDELRQGERYKSRAEHALLEADSIIAAASHRVIVAEGEIAAYLADRDLLLTEKRRDDQLADAAIVREAMRYGREARTW